MSPLQKRFGRLVAAHRAMAGLTQAQLADEIRMSVDMVAKVETGATAPSFATIERLAEALKADPAQFFTNELGGRPFERRALTELVADIARLSDPELRWLGEIVHAALKPRS